MTFSAETVGYLLTALGIGLGMLSICVPRMRRKFTPVVKRTRPRPVRRV
jgi:hypothetical protein